MRRQLAVEHDVAHHHPPAGPEHAGHLAEHLLLVRAQVDHAVADHYIDAGVIEGQILNLPFAELDIGKPVHAFEDPGVLPCQFQHFRRHVDTNGTSRRPHRPCGEEHVAPGAAAQVEHLLARLKQGIVRRVPAGQAQLGFRHRLVRSGRTGAAAAFLRPAAGVLARRHLAVGLFHQFMRLLSV